MVVKILWLAVTITVILCFNQIEAKHLNKIQRHARNGDVGVDLDRFYKSLNRKTKIENLNIFINRFDLLLDFVEANVHKLNLDGLFGLRIAEGIFANFLSNFTSDKLEAIQDENKKYKILKFKILCTLLLQRINSLTSIGLKNVKNDNIEYYNDFLHMIDKPFFINNYNIHTKLDMEFLNEIHEGTISVQDFNEQFSDSCYVLLMNSLDGNETGKGVCASTNECLVYFTKPSTGLYHLTHQLLYFIIAKHVNCSPKIIDDLKLHLKNDNQNIGLSLILNSNKYKENQELALHNYFCTKIYREASSIGAESDLLDGVKKDLFIEQLLLCGMLGFDDFLNDKWSNLILRFQQKNGCFGQNPANSDSAIFREENMMSLSEILFVLYNSKHHSRKHRIKRVDKYMGNDCSSHESGLGAAYYALVIRNYFEDLN